MMTADLQMKPANDTTADPVTRHRGEHANSSPPSDASPSLAFSFACSPVQCRATYTDSASDARNACNPSVPEKTHASGEGCTRCPRSMGMNATMRTVPSINSRGRIIAEYLADPDGVHPMRFDNAESASRVASTLGRGWSAFSAQGLGGVDHRWHVRRSK